MQSLTYKHLGLLELGLIIFLSLGQEGLSYSRTEMLDINASPLSEITKLPISKRAQEKLYEYLLHYGSLRSIYDLRKIKEITPVEFETLKTMIKVTPPESLGEDFLAIYQIQKSLATEEGISKAAVEEWQDLLITPLNVNKARFDELAILQNVSLVDVAAVIKHQRWGREIKNYRDLRDIQGLSNYGFRNMRNFVRYTDSEAVKFSGNFRINFRYGKSYDATFDPENLISSIKQSYEELENRRGFHGQGLSDYDIEKYYERLQASEDFFSQLNPQATISQRLRVRIGNNFILGLRTKDAGYPQRLGVENQGYIQIQKLGLINKFFLGDFRTVWGQGLVVDNTPEFIARTYTRTPGIYGDLGGNARLGFRGVSGEFIHKRLNLVSFYSQNLRDGVKNSDGTIFYYIISEPRLPVNTNQFLEKNYGIRVGLDLSSLGFLPVGTALAVNHLSCLYNKEFSSQTKWVDLPDDNTFFDDPNILELSSGKKRNFYSLDFRTVLENISLEGEYAINERHLSAYVFQARAQYEYLYILGLLRHYDLGYDNPYNRGFAEQKRFEDTPFEKPYRLIDPTFTALQNFPTPKAEEGIYLESRYQISRAITFTRVYLDIWRNLAYNLLNYRFQGEVEYRPVFPLRFRVKHKYQLKNLPKKTQATISQTHETSFRILASLTDRNFLSCELRRGLVYLVPSMAYNNEKTIWGDFLSATWEHNFSPRLGTEVGLAVWKCDGLSQWIFEDVGIDFLDGRGMKYYLVITQRPSKFLMFRVKLRCKYTEIPYTGVVNSSELHYQNSTRVLLRDFKVNKDLFNLECQLDFLW
jgi:hypothetical protein